MGFPLFVGFVLLLLAVWSAWASWVAKQKGKKFPWGYFCIVCLALGAMLTYANQEEFARNRAVAEFWRDHPDIEDVEAQTFTKKVLESESPVVILLYHEFYWEEIGLLSRIQSEYKVVIINERRFPGVRNLIYATLTKEPGESYGGPRLFLWLGSQKHKACVISARDTAGIVAEIEIWRNLPVDK